MKYKAKPSYKKLKISEGFAGLKSASSHIILMKGGVIEWDAILPKRVKDCLTEIKKKAKE